MSPICTILIFIIIAAISVFTLPQLKIDLLPQVNNNSFVINYELPNSTPAIVEQQTTSQLENAFSKLTDLKHINSVSAYNRGMIILTFGKYANLAVKKFETTSIIRRIYPSLPSEASYPVVSYSDPDSKSTFGPLLVYAIHSSYQSYVTKQFTEKRILPQLTGIRGVQEVSLSNADELQMVVAFDIDRCKNYNIQPAEISKSLQLQLSEKYPGAAIINNEQYFLRINKGSNSVKSIEQCILRSAPVIIRVKDIANVYFEEREPQQFFRINGRSALNISFIAGKGENVLAVARQIKEKIEKLNAALPEAYTLNLEHDDSIFIEQELTKNFRRITIAIICLFCFIAIVYRRVTQMLLLGLVLLVSMLLSILLVRIFGISVHLYSIAGLTISFSITLDNAIVMYDYYRQYRNRKIILSLLGGVLVIVSTLGIIFFLPDEERGNLQDFSLVIILSVLASALTNFLFTPALYEWMNKNRPGKKPQISRLKKYTFIYHCYFPILNAFAKRKFIVVVLLIVLFGLPVFMLPPQWDGNKWYHHLYNVSLGSNLYQERIRPYTDLILGGTLKLFKENVYEHYDFRSAGQTKINIDAELAVGNTPQTMNVLLSKFEDFLQPIKGIDKYITQISSPQRGSIQIFFTDKNHDGSLPYTLKSSLVRFAANFSGIKLNIYGVGKSFATNAEEASPTFLVKMSGYNYDELERLTGDLSNRLSKLKRVENINTDEGISNEDRSVMQYVTYLDPQKLAIRNISQSAAISALQNSTAGMSLGTGVPVDDKLYAVVIKEKRSKDYSIGNLMFSPVWIDNNRFLKFTDVASIREEQSSTAIMRADRKYIRVVSFQYRGSPKFGREYLNNTLNEMAQQMPIGYTAEEIVYADELKILGKRYCLIFLLLAFIYLICGILFESLALPFYVIIIVPVSFIGVFLIFSAGGFPFDQGGYASFILLGGLVASSAVYIISDLNKAGKRSFNESLARVVFNRGKTILLTTVASICGLTPFLIEGRGEIFWYSFSIGMFGGLIFSIIAIFFVLPVFLWKTGR